MFKRIVSLLTAILTAAFALSFAAFAGFNRIDEVRTAIDGIIACELQKNNAGSIQEWIDGSITENAGKSSEWFAVILSRSGTYDFSQYRQALEAYISDNNIASATSRMKNALALLAVGGNSGLTDEIAESSVGEQGVMSFIYGLHLLNNGCKCSRYTADTVTDELLSLQFADGGWAIMGSNGDIDVTAMAVQALAPQYERDDRVRAAVDSAVGFMSAKQQDDGGYVSFGTANPESAAQVLIAVSALGISADDPRFVKQGNDLLDGILKFRLADGSFSHTEGGDANDTATVQTYLAFTAYLMMQEDGRRLYDLAAEIQSETSETAVTSAPIVQPVTSVSSGSQITEAITETEPAPASPAAPPADYKPAAYCIIAGIAVISCIILFVLKKRRMSNFAAVFIAAGAAAAFIFFTDFRSSEEYYSGTDTAKDNIIGTVTMTIRCDTIVGKLDSPYVPEDGVILDTTEFALAEGETVYDILTEAAKKYGIQLQANGGYIAGIAYLYEYECGDLSGWIYHVNGDPPFVMCSDYKLSDGDRIEWLYTCELGNDLL